MRPTTLTPRLLFAALAAATCLALAPTPAEAQGRRGRRGEPAEEDEEAKGPSSKATLVLFGDREIEDVLLRDEKFAELRYKARGRRLESIEGEKVKEIRWLEAPGTFSSGLSQLRASLFDRAITSFTAARNTAEESTWLWFHATYRLGEAQLGAGNGADAAAEFKRLLEKDKDHWLAPAAMCGLGRALIAEGQHGPAGKAFEQLDEGYGSYWSAQGRLGMGDAALAAGNQSDAVRHYNFARDRAGTRLPDVSRAASVGIGKAYIADKKFDRAIRMFDEIIRTPGVDPDVAGGAWVGKGDCQLAAAQEKGNDRNLLKEALISYLTCAVRFAGTSAYPKALYRSAELYQRLGQAEQAEAARKELKQRCPSSPWTEKLGK